jgi:hypothetical protein
MMDGACYWSLNPLPQSAARVVGMRLPRLIGMQLPHLIGMLLPKLLTRAADV